VAHSVCIVGLPVRRPTLNSKNPVLLGLGSYRNPRIPAHLEGPGNRVYFSRRFFLFLPSLRFERCLPHSEAGVSGA
jgi:hypothetical protein